MYIIINENKVKFNSVLAGEKILIKIDKIQSIDENNMQVTCSFYVLSDYIARIRRAGNITEIPRTFQFTTDSHYTTVAAKMIVEKIIEDKIVTADDLQIEADVVWKEDRAIRSIRVTIPYSLIVEEEYYRTLAGALISMGIPNYNDNGLYMVYLEEIYPDDRKKLEADIRILIEE